MGVLNVDVAYETYGTLNRERSNAILVLHAFRRRARGGNHKETGQPGWWSPMIGPATGIRYGPYFVISSNVLGRDDRAQVSIDPSSIDTGNGERYGMRFPVDVTIGDMARLQKMLVEHLGIERLLAVAGGSMGGCRRWSGRWRIRIPSQLNRGNLAPQRSANRV